MVKSIFTVQMGDNYELYGYSNNYYFDTDFIFGTVQPINQLQQRKL